jgi:hypothetical protein
VKLWKWHTMVFRCPCCGHGADYAAQVIEGAHKGSAWDPTYWCEKCASPLRARDKWLFGGVFGPLMAIVGTFAYESVPRSLHLDPWMLFAFAAVCCAIVGYPLSRALSRHLVFWEPRDPKAQKRVQLRRAREDDE